MHTWKHPDSYGGFSPDGDYVICSQHRDSDALTRSNYMRIFEDLQAKAVELGCEASGINGEGNESPMVYDFRAGHWAVGWVETVLICHNAPEALLDFAQAIEDSLADYPVYDESHYCELEYNEVCEYWERSSIADRLDAIRHSAADCSPFAARHDWLPDDNGALYDYLRTA